MLSRLSHRAESGTINNNKIQRFTRADNQQVNDAYNCYLWAATIARPKQLYKDTETVCKNKTQHLINDYCMQLQKGCKVPGHLIPVLN